jgi:hypothetical protein
MFRTPCQATSATFMRDMQALLAGLLNRDFATVEIASYSSIIEFARAVEARWPCPQATATRERLEARQRHDRPLVF